MFKYLTTDNEITLIVTVFLTIEILNKPYFIFSITIILLLDISGIKSDSTIIPEHTQQRYEKALTTTDLDNIFVIQIMAFNYLRGKRSSVFLKILREMERAIISLRVFQSSWFKSQICYKCTNWTEREPDISFRTIQSFFLVLP